MEKANILKGLVMLGTTFNREVTEGLAEIYLSVFEDVSDEAFVQAVGRAIRECEYFPVPSKLRSLLPRRDEVAETNRRLDAMKPDPAKLPTREELEELHRAWVQQVKYLTRKLDAEPLAKEPTKITADEKAAALARIEAQLAERTPS